MCSWSHRQTNKYWFALVEFWTTKPWTKMECRTCAEWSHMAGACQDVTCVWGAAAMHGVALPAAAGQDDDGSGPAGVRGPDGRDGRGVCHVRRENSRPPQREVQTSRVRRSLSLPADLEGNTKRLQSAQRENMGKHYWIESGTADIWGHISLHTKEVNFRWI